jgi:molecular chaperone HscA
MFLQIEEPEEIHSTTNKIAIGIDLGTTNSLVAFVQEGTVKLVEHEKKELFIPSVVAFNANEVVVGKDATNCTNSIYSSKRFMSKPTKIIHDEKSAFDVAKEILLYLKNTAQIGLGKNVEDAVITVPAYFDDIARQATKDAAKAIGLNVLRLINEPTAAAFAYGLDKKEDGIYAVYDLGGGTFDISILKFKKGIFQVIATGGDGNLGGDDVDNTIVDFWTEKYQFDFCKKHLKKIAKKAKEILSKHESFFEDYEYGNIKANLFLNRDNFLMLIEPMIAKTLEICSQVLKECNLKKDLLDGLILVGGSSKLFSLKEKLIEFWQTKIIDDLDPEKVVAYGAALQADNLTNKKGNLLLDVNSLSLGMEVIGGTVEKIIPKNTPIPCSVTQKFTTFYDGQTSIKINILQGEKDLVKECISLAEFDLSGITPMPSGAPRVEVTFTLDVDGILNVRAFEVNSKMAKEIEVKPSFHNQNKLSSNLEENDTKAYFELKLYAKQILEKLKKQNAIYTSLEDVKPKMLELKSLLENGSHLEIKNLTSELEKFLKKN